MFDDDEAENNAETEDLGVEPGDNSSPEVQRERAFIEQARLMEQRDVRSQRCVLDPESSFRVNSEKSALRSPGPLDSTADSGLNWKDAWAAAKSVKEAYELIEEISKLREVVRARGRGGAVLMGVEFAIGEESTAPRQLDDVPGATTLLQRINDSKGCLP